MNEIIEAIHNSDKFEQQKDAYLKLPRDQRMALVEALREARDDVAGRFMTAILSSEADKEIRKLIKKLMFRLKTMGVKVEEPEAGGEPALRKITEVRHHKGFMSNYDDQNTRVVIIALEVKRNNFILINAVIHVTDGLVDLKLAPVMKHDLDEIIEAYQKGATGSIAFTEISPKYASYLIEEGDSISRRHTEDVRQLRQFTSTLKDEVQTPEDVYALKAPDDVEPLPAETILSSDLFVPFTLSWGTVDADRKTYSGLGSSTILLPAHMVKEKKLEFVENLISAGPLKSRIHATKRMLEDYAYIFHSLQRFEYFKGIIQMLGDEKGAIEALSFFIRRVLEVPTETEGQPQPGLILNPYEPIHR